MTNPDAESIQACAQLDELTRQFYALHVGTTRIDDDDARTAEAMS